MIQDFIIAVNNIKCDKKLTKDISISFSNEYYNLVIKITDNQNHASKLLTSEFKRKMGMLEHNAIRTNPLYAHARIKIKIPMNPMGGLVAAMHLLRNYYVGLWQIKDNCGDFELGYITYKVNKIQTYTSNFLSGLYFLSDGTRKPTTYSETELVEASKYEITKVDFDDNLLDISQLDKRLRRIDIAVRFLFVARQSSDLAIRIAFYINVFETLFSTDNRELSHKLSERVAHYLGTTKEEKLDIFKQMKDSYNIRSKVMHGSGLDLKKSGEKLIELSKTLDDYLRKIIKDINSDQKTAELFSLKNDKLENYFKELIFEKSSG